MFTKQGWLVQIQQCPQKAVNFVESVSTGPAINISYSRSVFFLILLQDMFALILFTRLFQGCYDKLKDYLEQNGILIGTCAIVVAVFMVSG